MENISHQSLDCSRQLLVKLYRVGVDAVDGYERTRQRLRQRPLAGPVTAIAIGKAATRMLEAARDSLGPQLQRALLITKTGYAPRTTWPRTTVIEAGHPLPDRASLAAGTQLLHWLKTLPGEHRLLLLISGGASSLVEVLPAGMQLDQLQRMNRWLLASGESIATVNALRSRLSRIKGGRLRDRVPLARTRVLLMSDVPDDDPALIGSGLLYRVAEAAHFPPLPDWLSELLDRYGSPPPGSDGQQPDTELVAGLQHAMLAIEAAAHQLGLAIQRYPERLSGDAETVGYALVEHLHRAGPGFHLWGGETTVRLPEPAGRGGRCQQLALAAAVGLESCPTVRLLAGATDGSDGPTDHAGACVDAGTCERGRKAGLDPRVALRRADAGTFLSASGDLISTGPTGGNVTDIVLASKAPPS